MLLYTADPSKRSPEWEEEAKAGMTDPKWRKEYKIDFTALSGEKVFPEIATSREKIIIREPHPEIDRIATCWGGFDYGSRLPSSFHVYTILDGVIYAIWELFEPCKNIPEFVVKMKGCPYWDQIRYIAADPVFIRNKTQQTKHGVVSVESLFAEEGVKKFIPGLQDESTWIGAMRKHWQTTDPTFRIFDCCPNMIREFEHATFVNVSERALITANESEEMVGKNNHSLDDCKYFMNSLPSTPVNYRKTIFPNITKMWNK